KLDKWIQGIEAIQKAFGCRDMCTLSVCRSKLRKHARDIHGLLDLETRKSWPAVKAALRAYFNGERERQIGQMKLYSCMQQQGQNANKFSRVVRAHFTNAYPGADSTNPLAQSTLV